MSLFMETRACLKWNNAKESRFFLLKHRSIEKASSVCGLKVPCARKWQRKWFPRRRGRWQRMDKKQERAMGTNLEKKTELRNNDTRWDITKPKGFHFVLPSRPYRHITLLRPFLIFSFFLLLIMCLFCKKILAMHFFMFQVISKVHLAL